MALREGQCLGRVNYEISEACHWVRRGLKHPAEPGCPEGLPRAMNEEGKKWHDTL